MNRTQIGPVQAKVLDRAARAGSGTVMPGDRRERMALQRLEARDIVVPALALPDVWTVKEDPRRGTSA